MGILKRYKNKKFSYKPRYYDDKGQGNPFEIKHKFDEFRSTVGSNPSLKTKFTNALYDLKNNQNKAVNRRIIIILTLLILLFLFIIDFNLSIFFS